MFIIIWRTFDFPHLMHIHVFFNKMYEDDIGLLFLDDNMRLYARDKTKFNINQKSRSALM